MDPKKKRREPRVDLSLPVTLQLPGGDLSYEISNASYRGIFIECSKPLQLQKLVRFKTDISDDGQPLQMLGLIAHTVNAVEAQEDGETPGMGIQLFSVGQQTRTRWREFISQEYDNDPDARQKVREMDIPRVNVHLRSTDQLKTFVEQDFNAGRIFVHTSELSPVDSTVVCDIIHPDDQRRYGLRAQVVEVTETPRRQRGMRVEFEPLDADERAAFDAFVAGERSDEVDDLDGDDLDADALDADALDADALAANDPDGDDFDG